MKPAQLIALRVFCFQCVPVQAFKIPLFLLVFLLVFAKVELH